MTPVKAVVVTGTVSTVDLALPSLELEAGPATASSEQFDPVPALGSRGLRYKDRATRLALWASKGALEDAGLWVDGSLRVPGDSIGVVASSNLGNLDTVCSVVDTIASETVAGTSPMNLPNASSNVVSSSIAIRFGLRGVNLMLCNGATSGVDALRWAMVLVRAGRVERVVVVGVETTNAVVERLCAGGAALDGAGAVVVESEDAARRRGARSLALIGAYARRGDVDSSVASVLGADAASPGTWFLPEGLLPGHLPSPLRASVAPRDLAASLGSCSGALGVLQCVAATAQLRAGATEPVLLTAGAGADDASASILLSPTDSLRSTWPSRPNDLRRRPHAERVGGLSVRLRRPAHAERPLRCLLLHGLGSSSNVWDSWPTDRIPELDLWEADLPWSGLESSAWTREPDLGRFVTEAMRHVPGGPDLVVAHSFAANVVLEMLERSVTASGRAFVLVSPFYRPCADDFDWDVLAYYVSDFARMLGEGVRLRSRPGLAADHRDRMALHLRDQIGPAGWVRFFETYLRTPTLRTAERSEPMLVITGDRDFAAFPADARSLAARLPECRLEVLADCGHFAMTEQPEQFTAVVGDFLTSLERRVRPTLIPQETPA